MKKTDAENNALTRLARQSPNSEGNDECPDFGGGRKEQKEPSATKG